MRWVDWVVKKENLKVGEWVFGEEVLWCEEEGGGGEGERERGEDVVDEGDGEGGEDEKLEDGRVGDGGWWGWEGGGG